MATESGEVNAGKAHDPGHAQDQNDPEAIRAEIRATREDMTATVHAIQEKLSPARIKEDAVQSVRQATIGRVEDAAEDARWKVKGVGNDVFETIKRNPAPAVLAAVGLGWLFMESRNRSGGQDMRRYREGPRGRQGDRYYYAGEFSGERSGRRGSDYGYNYDEYGRRSMEYGEPGFRDYGYEEQQGLKDRAGAVVGQAGDRVQTAARQATDKVQDVASQAADTVSSTADSVKDTAGQVVDSTRQGVQQVAHQAQYGAQRVGSRFGEIMEDSPLLVGAAAIAVGAILGFAFPTTEKENEIMGEARDRVMDKAQQKVSETAEKVQHVAQEATSAAKDAAKNEAQKQNLTSGSGH